MPGPARFAIAYERQMEAMRPALERPPHDFCSQCGQYTGADSTKDREDAPLCVEQLLEDTDALRE